MHPGLSYWPIGRFIEIGTVEEYDEQAFLGVANSLK